MAICKKILPVGAVGLMAAGCTGGLFVPPMQNDGIDITKQRNFEEEDENTILNHIQCEIRRGIENALFDPRFYPPDPKNPDPAKSIDWIRTWGAKVSYVFTVDEKGSIAPGFSWKEALATKGTTAGVSGGVQGSSESQRKETGAVTYAFADWIGNAPKVPLSCTDQDGVQIHSDLKIADFINNKLFVARVPGTLPNAPKALNDDKPLTLSAFSDEITFTVSYGANVTPSWVFVRLSVNPSGSLLSDTRSKTQYVSITLGPVATPSSKTSASQLNSEAQQIDSANLIGHAIGAALSRTTQ